MPLVYIWYTGFIQFLCAKLWINVICCQNVLLYIRFSRVRFSIIFVVSCQVALFSSATQYKPNNLSHFSCWCIWHTKNDEMAKSWFLWFFSGLSFKQWQFYSKQKRFKRTTKISIHVFASINSHTNKKKMYCAAPTAIPCTNSNNVCVINSCYHVMSRWLLPTSDYHSCREYVQKLFALLISTN